MVKSLPIKQVSMKIGKCGTKNKIFNCIIVHFLFIMHSCILLIAISVYYKNIILYFSYVVNVKILFSINIINTKPIPFRWPLGWQNVSNRQLSRTHFLRRGTSNIC